MSEATSGWRVPVLWGALLWSLLVSASQADPQKFYVLVRGEGAIPYQSAISFLGQSLDLALFLVLSLAVLGVHLLSTGFQRSSLEGGGAAALFLFAVVAFAVTGAVVFAAAVFVVFLFLMKTEISWRDDASGISSDLPLRTLAVFLAVLAGAAVLAAARWVLGGFDGSTPLQGWTWRPALVSLQLVGVLDQLLPALCVLFLFSWAIRLLGPWVLRNVTAGRQWGDRHGVSMETFHSRRMSILLLACGVVVGAFVGLYAYLPTVNPSSSLVGVDVYRCYADGLGFSSNSTGGACLGTDANYVLQRLVGVDMLKGLASMSGSDQFAFAASSVILSVLLCLSTYALVLEGTEDNLCAGVGALLAAVSPGIIVGINGGFIPNWLALCIGFLFFAALFRALRTRQAIDVVVTYALLVVILFTHPWTFAVILGVLLVYLSVTLVQARLSGGLGGMRLEAGILLSILLVGGVADLVRSVLPMGSGLSVAFTTLLPGLGLSNVSEVVSNLHYTFLTFLLGALADPIWFILGTIGVLSIPSLDWKFGRLLLSWLAASSFAIILLNSDTALVLQARFLYDVPVQLFAALGVVSILRHLGTSTRHRSGRIGEFAMVLLIVGITGLLLGFALDNVGFLYPPPFLR